MKRIINGTTYNTDTSTLMARAKNLEGMEETNYLLYQTRGGSCFMHIHSLSRRKTVQGEWTDVEHNSFEPMARYEAQEWVDKTPGVEIFGDLAAGEIADFERMKSGLQAKLGLAKPTPGVTIYLRIPASLKIRLERAAKEDGLSLNAWMMRCAEYGLQSVVDAQEDNQGAPSSKAQSAA